VRSIAASLLLLGCAPTPSPPAPDAAPVCGAAVLGDRSKDIDFEFRVVGADAIDKPLKDGDDVPLVFPPQGGRVVFVGVRATNIDPCAVQLSGAIRDVSTKQVRVDARTINLNPDGTGWGTSGTPSQSLIAAVSNYSNVPLCPNQWSATNVFDTPYELEVTLTEHHDANTPARKLTKTIKVTPRCSEPGQLEVECRCICHGGYQLGEVCDAGALDQ
jgi:hypothetical protein